MIPLISPKVPQSSPPESLGFPRVPPPPLGSTPTMFWGSLLVGSLKPVSKCFRAPMCRQKLSCPIDIFSTKIEGEQKYGVFIWFSYMFSYYFGQSKKTAILWSIMKRTHGDQQPFKQTLLRKSVSEPRSLCLLSVVSVGTFCCDLYLAHPQGPGLKSSLAKNKDHIYWEIIKGSYDKDW